MYLKELSIHGFKSFSEKAKLQFTKGITAVVGPNGSGKSNVSDAVRWVLGEQKAKTLRGEKMEDIIFAGTETRKPLGFAEVSITIDNQDKKMPIGFTEVTVIRRVYRSGESEYQINGVNCRLKDIHELFMDTGVGREGYSIIGQGRIDELLSAKADDRRRIFEEAAGIVKYKVRKNEAILKLEKEQQNLTRVEDIIQELEGQMGSLEKQSAKAKTYLALQEKIKQGTLTVFCEEVDRLEQEHQQQKKNHEIALENKKQVSAETAKQRQKAEIMAQESHDLKQDIQQLQEDILSIRSQKEKTESSIRLGEEQIQHFLQNIQRLEKEKEIKLEKKKENQEEILLLETKKTASTVKKKGLQQKLEEKETQFSALGQTLDENENLVDAYKGDIVEKMRLSTEAKGNIAQRETMLEQFRQRQSQIVKERAYLDDQIHAQKVHREVLEKQQKDWTEQLETLEQVLGELEENRKMTLAKKEEIAREQRNREQALGQKRSRFSVLSDMEREHEGFFKSVKSVLAWKASGKEAWQGICGAVGELLQVSQQYEAAIEAALGGSMQHIVTRTEEDARDAIQYLKQNHLGRATFLPLTAVKGKKLEKGGILEEQGVLGIASDLVAYDAMYQGIVTSLLGRTIIIEGLEQAVVVAKKYRHQYRIVTLDGDLLNPGGAMTGGSTAKKTSSIFSRGREIHALQEAIQAETTLLAVCQKELETLEQALEENQKHTMETHIKYQEIQLSLEKNKEDFQSTEISQKERQERQKSYHLEERQLAEQCQRAEREIAAFRQEWQRTEQEMEQIHKRLSSFQDSVEEERQQREQLLQGITEVKINLSKEEQNRQSILETIQRLEGENSNLEREKTEILGEIESFLEQKGKKEEKRIQLEEKIETFTQEENKKQQKLTEISDRRQQKKLELARLEEGQRSALETISKLEQEIFRLETKLEKIAEERQRQFDEIWDAYEMTYQMAKVVAQENTGKSYQQIKTETQGWKTELKALGYVNVGAIETYREVKERYGFLTTQRLDILEAEEKLRLLIAELSQLMEDRFREQFAVISENFGEVFREMFGGGKAYLKLSDETKVLESSIDIIAQPPGKSLQNMMLLSGGERALTAIAILFSILKMKPSPFCILDEIEAALDDANVRRFAEYLKKFSGETQFIVITHRKGTMEVADVLYGVTMQEKGVSKMISVQFEDRADMVV